MAKRFDEAVTWGAGRDSGVTESYAITEFGKLVFICFAAIVAGVASLVMTLVVATLVLNHNLATAIRWGVIVATLPPGGVLVLIVFRVLWTYAEAWLESILGVDLNQSGAVGDITVPELPKPDIMRIVPYQGGSTLLVDGVDDRDLRAFVMGLPIKGHTQKNWIGVKMPSGATVTPEYWTRLCSPLRKIGVLQGVERRKAGTLTIDDPDRILDLLGLS